MFKLTDQFPLMLRLVGDDTRHVRILRMHLIERLFQTQSMLLCHSKYDSLPWYLSGFIFITLIPDLLPLSAQGIFIADLFLKISALKVYGIRVKTLLI